MLRTLFIALALGLIASSASAMPLIQGRTMAGLEDRVTVKIVCEENGYCYHRGRRPVARWVYGAGNFDGPYMGPGNYGRPGHHWVWWPFLGY